MGPNSLITQRFQSIVPLWFRPVNLIYYLNFRKSLHIIIYLDLDLDLSHIQHRFGCTGFHGTKPFCIQLWFQLHPFINGSSSTIDQDHPFTSLILSSPKMSQMQRCSQHLTHPQDPLRKCALLMMTGNQSFIFFTHHRVDPRRLKRMGYQGHESIRTSQQCLYSN